MATNSNRRNTAFDLTKSQFTSPQNRLDANRWLNYATFGAGTAETDITASTKTTIVPLAGTQDDATQLMSVGYTSYVNAQLSDNSIPSLYDNGAIVTPLPNSNSSAGNFGDPGAGPHAGTRAWFYTQAIHGTAQIRLKTAYALSQIFVINGGGNFIPQYQLFYDFLVKSTLSTNTSSYKELLRQVTYSRAMAQMLSYDGNIKENVATNSRPDENYAREILQLFSLGLKQLKLNGEPILDSNGVELQTYDPQDIPQVARIFTGLVSSDTNQTQRYLMTEVAYANTHETGTKVLFAYPFSSKVTMPAYTGTYYRPVDTPPNLVGYVIKNATTNTFQIDLLAGCQDTRAGVDVEYSLVNDRGVGVAATTDFVFNTPTLTLTKTAHGLTNGTRIYIYSTAQKDIEYFLDYVFNHPNVAPFISKSLIKFFVTSNPTTNYVERVAKIFNNNGNGVRGDISSVVKAILLDREAIIPYGINPNNHGRYTTVVDRYIKVARAFKSDMFHILGKDNTQNSALPKGFENDFLTNYPYFTKPRNLKDYGACGFFYTGTFQPTESPSVFNFFRPGYTPPGSVLGTINKTSPESQVNTVDSQIVWSNAINSLCETENFNDGGVYSNPQGNIYSTTGFDFTLNTNGFTVTASPPSAYGTMTVSGLCAAITSRSGDFYFWAKRRSDGKIFPCITSVRPVGAAGVKSFNVDVISSVANTILVNDILDFSPLALFGQSGWPSASMISGGNQETKQEFQPCIMTLYKIANLIPSTASPTTTDLNPAIDYMESILMSRPISSQVRALMVQAGQAPVTTTTPQLVGDATFNNNWLNIVYDIPQKRARRMLGILLVSPEFSTLT